MSQYRVQRIKIATFAGQHTITYLRFKDNSAVRCINNINGFNVDAYKERYPNVNPILNILKQMKINGLKINGYHVDW